MRTLSLAILLTLSCAGPNAGNRTTQAQDIATHRWVNEAYGETIVLTGDTYTIAGRSYQLRDCSDASRHCVESDGPINLIVNRSCATTPSQPIGEHRTGIWSVSHNSVLLRDSRSRQVLVEYSYHRGVTAIYYSPEGLGMTDTTGPDFSQVERHRYTHQGRRPYLPCRWPD